MSQLVMSKKHRSEGRIVDQQQSGVDEQAMLLLSSSSTSDVGVRCPGYTVCVRLGIRMTPSDEAVNSQGGLTPWLLGKAAESADARGVPFRRVMWDYTGIGQRSRGTGARQNRDEPFVRDTS